MMKVYETNCIVVTGLTDIETKSYFEKFGEQYYNDKEEIICIPLQKMNEFEMSKLEMFFAVDDDLSKSQYLVIEF